MLSTSAPFQVPLGTHITARGVPGSPVLTVVGEANSITQSADGWVLPAEIAALRAPASVPTAQLLYRFAAAGTVAMLRADVQTLVGSLPPGALSATQNYLAARQQQTSSLAPIVPFVVTFGILGLVLSVLVVVNVVSGAVAAGSRRIGRCWKSIGFTPGQSRGHLRGPGGAAYRLVGAVSSRRGGSQQRAVGASAEQNGERLPGRHPYGPGLGRRIRSGSDVLPGSPSRQKSSRRAGPGGFQRGRGDRYRARAAPGLRTGSAPVARSFAAAAAGHDRSRRAVCPALPAAAMTLAAVLLGRDCRDLCNRHLTGSLNRVVVGQSTFAGRAGPGLRAVGPERPGHTSARPHRALPSVAVQERDIQAALWAQPGTLRYVAEADERVSVVGLTGQVDLTAFRGDARWTGYDLISGRWYAGARPSFPRISSPSPARRSGTRSRSATLAG